MSLLSDLPPFVIDQILGAPDTSYVVIKLWICGDKKLHDRLSRGLTLLDLCSHSFGSFFFPRMVSQLRSLRHLSVSSQTSLVREWQDWPGIVRSWPSTLESLAIYDGSQTQHFCSNIETTSYPRGSSNAVELEALFPRLHTLSFKSPYDGQPPYAAALEAVSSDLFPALPSSLTLLEGPISLEYFDDQLSHLSRLPPGIQRLTGPVMWTSSALEGPWQFDKDLLDAVRIDFAKAPSTLQALITDSIVVWAKNSELENASCECWLPKSLLEIDWTESYETNWSPALARTMPPNLRKLALGDINFEAYAVTHTNWVADLPRTVTDLTVAPTEGSNNIDLLSYLRFLPGGLADLTLIGNDLKEMGAFGDWSSISEVDYWPSNLTSLQLLDFGIEPYEIVHLPKTLTSLVLRVQFSGNDAAEGRSILRTSLLPPKLTELGLEFTPNVALDLRLNRFNLRICTLSLDSNADARLPCSLADFFPDTLVKLKLENLGLFSPKDLSKTPEKMLPNLKDLIVDSTDCATLKHLPRSIRALSIRFLSGIPKSPTLADGHLFNDLPPSLVTFLLLGIASDLPNAFELPPQSFAHLPSLTNLRMDCALHISSGMLRTLPRSLRHLQINITKLAEDDLPFLPPRLLNCHITDLTPRLVESMPLASLSALDLEEGSVKNPELLSSIARERVRHAANHQ